MSDKSHTSSGTAKPAIASKSKSRSIDSNMLRTSSARSGVVDSSGIGSFLGKAFGGSASLDDLVVGNVPLDPALRPHEDYPPSVFDVTVAADEATVFPDGRERHAVAEIDK